MPAGESRGRKHVALSWRRFSRASTNECKQWPALCSLRTVKRIEEDGLDDSVKGEENADLDTHV